MRSRSPRVLVLCLALWFDGPVWSAAEEPTAEQLKAAQKAFAKLGATHEAMTDARTKMVTHRFRMPPTTQDAALKKLLNPEFSFALDFSETQVTDAGLKELKELKGLTTLYLSRTKVTDAGLKELREALPKCEIFR